MGRSLGAKQATMNPTGTTLLVQTWIDRDFGAEDGWVERVLGDAPFHGLFATGTDFADARCNAARVVLEAHHTFRPEVRPARPFRSLTSPAPTNEHPQAGFLHQRHRRHCGG